jgi:hypothetical protein
MLGKYGLVFQTGDVEALHHDVLSIELRQVLERSSDMPRQRYHLAYADAVVLRRGVVARNMTAFLLEVSRAVTCVETTVSR